MIDADGAQRAREWLERQLAELGQLRNATRRDPTFKNWRQQTLTVIQRLWPGDTRRSERFRRIPFTPPSTHATERQVREAYERGWGEAGILLRELLAEINLLGLPRVQPRGYADAGGPVSQDYAPVLDLPATPEPPPEEDSTDIGRADIGRAMERLLGRTPLFRMPSLRAPAPPAAPQPAPEAAPATPVAVQRPTVPATPVAAQRPFAPAEPVAAQRPSAPAASVAAQAPLTPAEPDAYPMAPEPAFLVSELGQLVDELDGLGLGPERTAAAREALVALARAIEAGPPPWKLVSEALALAGASPTLARRALPLLLELVARAA